MDYKDFKIPKCKKFSGYKPCISYRNCLEEGCRFEKDKDYEIGIKILIISLDALGNVLLNTSILKQLKLKYPVSTVYWITMPNAEKILMNNNFIDRVFVWTDEQRMILRNIKFDILLNSDKSDYACAFANEVIAINKYGFLLNEDGKIIPANNYAMYSYIMGIDDKIKFKTNKKTGIEIIHEVFNIHYNKDEYIFNLTNDEKHFIEDYKKQIGYDEKTIYAGFNTGCSNLFPNKKMTIEQHIYLINEISKSVNIKIVLLGGKEDTDRNIKIYNLLDKEVRNNVINTPTLGGIRRGACYIDICDIVITGDSFGMHLAIALKKFVIAWFGLSCWNEIELFGRGIKLYPEKLECAPCWKKECPYNLECISKIDLDKIIQTVKNYKKNK